MDDYPRLKLCELITQYGRSFVEEPGRCEGYLRDYCSQYRSEVNILLTALKERVPADLLNSSQPIPIEL
jgi:hypothetical protein